MNRCRPSLLFLAFPFAVIATPVQTQPDTPRLGAPLYSPSRSAAAPAEKPASAGAEAYQQGIERLASNDLEGAQAAFRRALQLQPGYADAMLGLAEVASRRNRQDEAARLIRDAVKAEPGNAHAQASLGRLQAVSKQYGDAETSLKKAIELDPRLIRPKMDLADLYATALRKPQEALALYKGVLAIDPSHAGASYASGIVLAGLGDLPAAQQALETAHRLEPGNPLPMLALARVAAGRNDLDGATKWVEQALAVQPRLVDALELRGDLQQRRGEPDKALADYAAALKAGPPRLAILLKQGSLQQQLGRNDAATESYRAAIKLDPRAAIAYNNLAWMAAESGRNLEQAEGWARKAVELGPNAPDFHDTLGWVQRARGNTKAAEKTLLQAASMKGAPADTFYHLGVVQAELGKPAEAAAAFEKALALQKSHQPAAEALRKLRSR